MNLCCVLVRNPNRSSAPLDIDVEIIFLNHDALEESDRTKDVSIGDISVIRCEGVDIVLVSNCTNVYQASFFATTEFA